ncbi:MAG: ABC transporter permease [Chloroflexota bacterium]
MKRWLEPLITAWVAVITHKLRSFLTVLGVVIGVGAVITLMSIGKGTQATILSRIESLGSDLMFIRSGSTSQFGVRTAQGSATTLTLEDAESIKASVPGITVAVPSNSTSQQLVYGSQNTRTQIVGTTTEYQIAYNLKLASGVFFSDNDYENGTRVAVLGATVKETLFPSSDPLGQTLRMGNQIVRIIGVLETKGASMGTSTDDAVMIPLTAMQQMFSQSRTSRGEHVVNSIAVKVSDLELSDAIVADITSLLRSRHQLATGKDDDFSITSMEEIASTVSETTQMMTLLLGAIAAISLLVGGIGVMNIMLVSVVERTREIGIRKALGARERDIWVQFLIEAAFLSVTGGIIGITTGWGASALISRFSPMTTLVSADIVLLAISVSVGIGLFFGFYPAWNASRLEPIQALRSE